MQLLLYLKLLPPKPKYVLPLPLQTSWPSAAVAIHFRLETYYRLMLLKWKANTISSIKPQIPTINKYLISLREEKLFLVGLDCIENFIKRKCFAMFTDYVQKKMVNLKLGFFFFSIALWNSYLLLPTIWIRFKLSIS